MPAFGPVGGLGDSEGHHGSQAGAGIRSADGALDMNPARACTPIVSKYVHGIVGIFCRELEAAHPKLALYPVAGLLFPLNGNEEKPVNKLGVRIGHAQVVFQ